MGGIFLEQEAIVRKQLIEELESLDIVTIPKPNYEEMSTEALKTRLRISKTLFEHYFKEE